jgi:5-methylcytosine-specific restriction protein A
VALTGKHPAPDSPAIDHIIDHNGNASLFWDRDNLQAVSKQWHDTEKQRQERRAAR